MQLNLLRIYLLAGLIAHKLIWEALKRRPSGSPPRTALSLRVRIVKLLKLAILIGILVQTCVRDVLPISPDPLPLQIGGTILFTLGLLTAISARLQLGDNWSDIEVARVREGHGLVST